MSGFYDGFQAVASSLIGGKGQSVTLRQVVAGGYNPATGTTGTTSTDYAGIPAVIVGYKTMEIDGTKVVKGDKRAIISGADLSVVPKIDDLVLVGGVAHKVMDVETVAPGGVAVIYKLQLRK